MEDEIVSRLQAVGFSLYEARLYLALVEGGSQNGNEVSKRAGVPSSKTYAALEKLASSGFVQSSRQGSSTRWAALPPDELVARLRRHFTEPLDVLGVALPKVATAEPSEPFLTISGLKAMRAAAVALIDAASVELHLSCWESELDALREALAAADSRGVRIFGMLYGAAAEAPPGTWLQHHYEDIVADRVRGRLLALVVDDREALVARLPKGGEPNAVRSSDPAMTLIVKEYLHHDSVLQRAQLNIGFTEWDRWWQADPEVRAEILGDSMGVTDE